jgi:hypothetical protein
MATAGRRPIVLPRVQPLAKRLTPRTSFMPPRADGYQPWWSRFRLTDVIEADQIGKRTLDEAKRDHIGAHSARPPPSPHPFAGLTQRCFYGRGRKIAIVT